jgi:predicted metal-dependent TIM-barrel fold hydrolase
MDKERMKNGEREYCVGVKIHNCYYVSAKTRDEAIEKVQDMTNDEILLDSDFNIEYADPTNGEIAWKIKANEVDLDQINQSIPRE